MVLVVVLVMGEGVVCFGYSTHVVALQVEVGKVEGDAVLGRCEDLPYAVFVARIQVREGRARYRPVRRIDQSSTSI